MNGGVRFPHSALVPACLAGSERLCGGSGEFVKTNSQLRYSIPYGLSLLIASYYDQSYWPLVVWEENGGDPTYMGGHLSIEWKGLLRYGRVPLQ